MGLFDRFLKRKSRKRGFSGMNTGRLFADFSTMTRSSDSELKPALRILRNRCRELARNDEYVRRYLQLLKTNVVGQGVSVQAKARNADGSLDAPGNRLIERAWASWCKRGVCTVDGRLSFVDAQRLVVETLSRDGEVLVRLIPGADNPDRFAIQFLEADLRDEQLITKMENGNRVRMGVEIDDFGRSVAYHLLKEHPGDQEFTNAFSRKHTRVAASTLLHIFQSDRPHQTRGAPPMATAINSLKMLHGYREAELVAARVSAAKMGFITSPDGDGYSGDDLENTHTPVMAAEPGSVEQLPAGMKIDMFDPQHPVTAFSEFHKAVLRGIASSLGVSYAALASDLESVNYSSIRQGALDERDHYRTIQQFLVQHFIAPVFQAWLSAAMTSGNINLPMPKFEKFSDQIIYRPRGFSWVDPQKEINAQVTGIQNGLLSMQDVATHYGADIEDVFENIQREKELAAQYGISLAFQPFGNKANAEPIVTSTE